MSKEETVKYFRSKHCTYKLSVSMFHKSKTKLQIPLPLLNKLSRTHQ